MVSELPAAYAVPEPSEAVFQPENKKPDSARSPANATVTEDPTVAAVPLGAVPDVCVFPSYVIV